MSPSTAPVGSAAPASADDHTEFDHTSADVSTFPDTLDLRDLAQKYDPSERFVPSVVWYRTIETLSPVKTVGLGRTNVTLIMPTIVQTDATTPYAGFDRRATPNRNPVAQVHFLPAAYGNTAPATYVVSFSIETTGPVTFTVSAPTFIGGVSGAGSRSVDGATNVSVVFSQLAPTQPVYVALEQTTGAQWNWYSTRIAYPPFVLQLCRCCGRDARRPCSHHAVGPKQRFELAV